MLVGDLAGAPTRVVCGANTGNASAVCNCGGDRAIFHATLEEIVVNADDILAWRGANVSGIGNCVLFACGDCTAVSLPVDCLHLLVSDFVGNFWWECLLGDGWGVVTFVLFNLAQQQGLTSVVI